MSEDPPMEDIQQSGDEDSAADFTDALSGSVDEDDEPAVTESASAEIDEPDGESSQEPAAENGEPENEVENEPEITAEEETNGVTTDAEEDTDDQGGDTTDDQAESEYETADDDDVGELPDPSETLRENMTTGFLMLKNKRAGSGTPAPQLLQAMQSQVTVNFIDPTASGMTKSSSTQKFSFMSPLGGGTAAAKGGDNNTMAELELYQNLCQTFDRAYKSTLQNVPYEHPKTGVPSNIESLSIKTVLAQSQSSSASDPAEWHTGPYCHVYLAACESIEHYRSKVRPSLQAFLSQLEGASKSSGKTMHNYSGHYVIVYVPVRKILVSTTTTNEDGTVTTASTSATVEQAPNSGGLGSGRLGGAIASRLTNARRSLVSGARGSLDDSIHSTGSGFSTGDESSALPSPHSSKMEKEIFKKFSNDFPSGRTCILSTQSLMLDSAEASPQLKSQEWNGFLRSLGTAIVSGFRDRCRRYQEEMRRLDAARASNGNAKTGVLKFDLGHYFLVKESLAFTYEQMSLPSEALLQYEELRALLPQTSGDDVDTDEMRMKKMSKLSKRLLTDFSDDNVNALAVAGDCVGFRKRLRAVTDFGIVEQSVLQYLYAREISLLFQMSSPVEILQRSHTFVQIMYKMKCAGTGMVESGPPTEEEMEKRKLEAEFWALQFCWDVKCATDKFFTVLDVNYDKSVQQFSFSTMDPEHGYIDYDAESEMTPAIDHEIESIEKHMAFKIGELLEFARLRFLRLGDEQTEFENPIRQLTGTMPKDMQQPWKPWVAVDKRSQLEPEDSVSELESPSRQILAAAGSGNTDFLQDALATATEYEARYLQIASAVARCNLLSGRRRLASRFQTQVAEIYMKRNDHAAAVTALLPIVDVCATDGWDRCHFWHLFRLACCQRTNGKVPAYLNTLTLCFGPHLIDIAPKAAAQALQKDFEAVVSHPDVSQLRLGISSFMETDLVIEKTSGGKSSMLLNFVRKKFVKSFCKVGEALKVKLAVKSFLPNAIECDGIHVLVVTLGRFEECFHNRTPVSSSDAFETMTMNQTTIQPGNNTFEFEWTPLSTDIYALATVQMQWKSACFHYDSAALRKPLLGIEIGPSDPAQTIELNPLFLIPGQQQQVRITFNSGSDIITEGTVELVCSDGLQVIPPGTDVSTQKWVEACSVDLPPCNASGASVLTTFVKSRLVKSMSQKLGLSSEEDINLAAAVQTMQARVMTSYHHESYKDSKASQADSLPCMRTTLEAMVTTLDKPAFTVDECRAYCYSEDNVLISVLLHCNTPVPFAIKEWEIDLPSFKVVNGGDVNQELFGHTIAEGEQLTLAFDCKHIKSTKTEEEQDEPVLKLVLKDEHGKTFHQVLSLDLYFLYDQMKRDQEFSVTNSVNAALTCSSLEGLVGAPVTFTVKIDAASVEKPESASTSCPDGVQLLYQIKAEETDWIVGGKVKGLVNCTKAKTLDVEFVGIPVRPGVVKRFPTLVLQHDEKSPPMTVHLRHPDNFKSLSFVNHMALACPAGLDV